ncbi:MULTISPECIES: DUF3107 domain-containing protein [Thermomonospora]|uniref:ATP-binding protein n=1 Tax=Thermomonospora curvata (strain ATCC 19995 / DSM 43183 / JCM 3096 / KCTC 9072 / NBRC 15933 / NCIMB 10081 / Henssen B9) TaxID=471852 RepID=D1A990_THECD|nr:MULTISPECIES: DUF3107 domain-containing protein [Thermomonospora]ACY96786.1 hypothetical protein Tcur_1203 [Thermomonospora curvata DSM 43183]PKK15328.1 MAG: DUF3107 domain-containing protein [Thermomonospora sp. CIF 1]
MVQVRIGVQYTPKELVIETSLSADEVERALAEALAAEHGVLALHDQRGGRVLIPADRIGYLEIGEENNRKVGFGSM